MTQSTGDGTHVKHTGAPLTLEFSEGKDSGLARKTASQLEFGVGFFLHLGTRLDISLFGNIIFKT